MADDAPQSLDELVANLATYKEQLNDVDELLKSDPTNAEFLEVKAVKGTGNPQVNFVRKLLPAGG